MYIQILHRELKIAEENAINEIDEFGRLGIKECDLILGWEDCGTVNCHTYIVPKDKNLVSWVNQCCNILKAIRASYNVKHCYTIEWDMDGDDMVETEDNTSHMGFIASIFLYKTGCPIQSALMTYEYMTKHYDDFIK